MEEQDPRERLRDLAISAEKEVTDKVSKAIRSEESSRRWFWELLQNAVDTVADDDKVSVEIVLELRDNKPVMTFSHDGGPFKYSTELNRFDDFKNLIVPVSGKSRNDKSKIGKFGTGFLSTHKLAEVVDVEGKFLDRSGNIFFVQTTLDRTGVLEETEEARNLRIERIIDALFKYESSKNIPYDAKKPTARFTYHLKETNAFYQGCNEIDHSLPFVMAFLPKIQKVTIVDGLTSKTIIYENKGVRESKFDFLIHETIANDVSRYIATLSESDITLAWPIAKDGDKFNFIDIRSNYKNDLNHEMCTLFCYNPLIGSIDFKFPVVIHSSRFAPNSERDGIDLKGSESPNKAIVESAVKLYKKFLQQASSGIGNLFLIADTITDIKKEHRWIDKSWHDLRRDDMRGYILATPLVDVTKDEKDILLTIHSDHVCFPADEKLYGLAAPFYKNRLPKLSLLSKWLPILWDDNRIQFIRIKDLIVEISRFKSIGSGSLLTLFDSSRQNLTKHLSSIFDHIIDQEKDESLFNLKINNVEYGIVPSREGSFRPLASLKQDIGHSGSIIEKDLLDIYDNYKGTSIRKDLLESFFKQFSTHKPALTEIEIANSVSTVAEEYIKEIDKIDKSDFPNHLLKGQYQSKLSSLYSWVVKFNSERGYYSESFKRKLLNAIIPEEKALNITKILECDRNGKVQLSQLVQIAESNISPARLATLVRLCRSSVRDERLEELVDEIDEEVEDRSYKNKKGKAIEDLVDDLLNGDSQTKRYNCLPKGPGEADFIITNAETGKQAFLEIKSHGNDTKPSKLYISQARKAVACIEHDNFILGVITRASNDDENSTDYIRQNMRFAFGLGKKLEPFIKTYEQLEPLRVGRDGVSVEFEREDVKFKVERSVTDQGYPFGGFKIRLKQILD